MQFCFNARLCRLFWATIVLSAPFAVEGVEPPSLAPQRLPPVTLPTARTSRLIPVDPPRSILQAELSIERATQSAPDIRSESLTATTLPGQSIDPLELVRSLVTPHWNDPTTSLPAAADQAAELVKRASTRASRGALYSARHELEVSLSILSQALDTHHGTNAFTQCFRQGLLAMEEAGDFSRAPTMQRTIDVALTVSKHRCGVLSAKDVHGLSPVGAARKYYAYAQEHLAASAGGAPVAAHALFGLGKLYMGMCQSEVDTERLYGPRAMMMHQTALVVDGSYYLAANELGVLLARFGRHSDARDVFKYGLSIHSTPETWNNLADIHDRLGEGELAQLARAEGHRAGQLSNSHDPSIVTIPNGLNVRWVDKSMFERGIINSGGNPELTSVQTPRSVPASAARPALSTTNRW